MENGEAQQTRPERRRTHSENRSEGRAYDKRASAAINKETDYKLDLDKEGPVISTTVVGENVTFTQNFNF